LAATEQPISFAQNIKPLFREGDRESMKWAFDLSSYDDVAANSDAILAKLRDGTMPCDGAWAEEQVDLFQRWVDAGSPAWAGRVSSPLRRPRSGTSPRAAGVVVL